LAGAIAALLTPAAYAEIELGEGFAVTGFIDMSYKNVELDGPFDSEFFDETSDAFAIDQAEIDFLYTGTMGVSGQLDIEYAEDASGGSDSDTTFVEQAFITKVLGESNFSVKAGRFLSYSGFEAEEPTGLYQYSTVGYEVYFYGWYQQGVSGSYNGDTFQFMASVVNSAFDPLDGSFYPPVPSTDPDVELGIGFTPGDEDLFTAKAFYIDEAEDEVMDFWAMFTPGDFTIGAEYITRDYGLGGFAGDGGEGEGYLLMANWAPGTFGITVRYGAYEIKDSDSIGIIDTDSITVAPIISVGDNLLVIPEYRIDSDNLSNVDSETIAVEFLFSF
jgi:hypothetical protein